MATWQKEKQQRHLANVMVAKAIGGHDVQPGSLQTADGSF